MNKHIITEISPLSEKDCLFIVERYKTEFTYPLHNHKEYELNFVENGAGVRRIVGDSVEEIGDYDLVLLCGDKDTQSLGKVKRIFQKSIFKIEISSFFIFTVKN